MEWNCTLSYISGEVWTLSSLCQALESVATQHLGSRLHQSSLSPHVECHFDFWWPFLQEGITFHGLYNEKPFDFSTVIWSPNCEAKVWLCYFSNIAEDGATHATVPSHPMVLCVRDHSDLRGKHHLGNFDHFFRTQSFMNHSISLALSASALGPFLQCLILAILATPLIQTGQNLHRIFPQDWSL